MILWESIILPVNAFLVLIPDVDACAALDPARNPSEGAASTPYGPMVGYLIINLCRDSLISKNTNRCIPHCINP
jgi:hypothetical protein